MEILPPPPPAKPLPPAALIVPNPILYFRNITFSSQFDAIHIDVDTITEDTLSNRNDYVDELSI